MSGIDFRKLLLATTTLALGAGGIAHAQDAVESDEVVVTGSRLTNGFQAPTPVTVLGTQQIDQRAATTISDVVNEIPSFRQTVTNTQSQRGNGNNGQNRVDLRGLGDIRTLVLLDGRRITPTNLTGTVDINLIPTPLVNRIEVVTGGASAAYGSDAVSGVVNFILKDKLEGFEGSAQYGASQQNDNIEPALGLAYGKSLFGDKGHLLVGGEYSNNRGIGTIYSRDWGRKQPGVIAFGNARAAGVPANGLAENISYSQQTDGAIILNNAANKTLQGTYFAAGGVPTTSPFGQIYSNVMIGNQFSPDANPFGNWNISAPHERTNFLSRFTYDLTNNVSAWAEFGYGHLENHQTITYHQEPNLIVPITNPYIPAATRLAMQQQGLTQITVGRYDTELGGYLFNNKQWLWRGAAGLKGKIGEWDWDVSASHGVNRFNAQLLTNIWEGNYLAATYVVTGAGGQPECGPIATNPNLNGTNTNIANVAIRRTQVEAGCQPFNIFGRNSASEAAKDYIKGESNNLSRYEQNVYAANISGSPFNTWAGAVSVATGIEHRAEEGLSQQNDFGLSGGIGGGLSNNGSTFKGKFDVTEGFVEVGVPILRDATFAKAIDLNGAVRRTHYSTSGSVTTWKAGATWEVNDFLRLRGVRSRDIRAPNINELFASGATGITANARNPINGQTGSLFTQGGGNPNLTPEIADSWTAGFVVQPGSFLTGLRASVDYYSVEINDVIASVAAADILQRCANGITSYCALIDFNTTTFGIALVHTTPANLNKLETTGTDIEIGYRVPLENFKIPGEMDVRSFTTYVSKLATTDAIGTIDRAGFGTGGVPQYVSNLSMTYKLGNVSNTFQVKYNSSFHADATLCGPDQSCYVPSAANSTNKNAYPSMTYFNWSGAIDVINEEKRQLSVFAVVNNVFDTDPPQTALVGLIQGGDPYDLVGRYFKAGVRFKF